MIVWPVRGRVSYRLSLDDKELVNFAQRQVSKSIILARDF